MFAFYGFVALHAPLTQSRGAAASDRGGDDGEQRMLEMEYQCLFDRILFEGTYGKGRRVFISQTFDEGAVLDKDEILLANLHFPERELLQGLPRSRAVQQGIPLIGFMSKNYIDAYSAEYPGAHAGLKVGMLSHLLYKDDLILNSAKLRNGGDVRELLSKESPVFYELRRAQGDEWAGHEVSYASSLPRLAKFGERREVDHQVPMTLTQMF